MCYIPLYSHKCKSVFLCEHVPICVCVCHVCSCVCVIVLCMLVAQSCLCIYIYNIQYSVLFILCVCVCVSCQVWNLPPSPSFCLNTKQSKIPGLFIIFPPCFSFDCCQSSHRLPWCSRTHTLLFSAVIYCGFQSCDRMRTLSKGLLEKKAETVKRDNIFRLIECSRPVRSRVFSPNHRNQKD